MAKNHLDVLQAAGLGYSDIVSGHVYLKDINDYAPMNKVYKEFFSAGPGVRTCLMPNGGWRAQYRAGAGVLHRGPGEGGVKQAEAQKAQRKGTKGQRQRHKGETGSHKRRISPYIYYQVTDFSPFAYS